MAELANAMLHSCGYAIMDDSATNVLWFWGFSYLKWYISLAFQTAIDMRYMEGLALWKEEGGIYDYEICPFNTMTAIIGQSIDLLVWAEPIWFIVLRGSFTAITWQIAT